MNYKDEKKIGSLNVNNLKDTFVKKENKNKKDPRVDSVLNHSNINNLMGNYIKTSFKPASKDNKKNSHFDDAVL